MSAIWVVLLDVSGSMGEKFSGKVQQQAVLAETGRWQTKLEAAKELLVRQVHAARGQDISVIAFASHARLVFLGSLDEFRLWEPELYKLQPEDQTNLAEALNLARDEKRYEAYDAISALVITDGLSNVGNPELAAKELISKYRHCRIDTILIDETDEGRAVAEAVSINGWIRPAYTLLQLEEAITSGRVTSLRQTSYGFVREQYAIQHALAKATGQEPPALLTLSSPAVFELTPATLGSNIAPFLSAAEGLQRTACDLYDKPYNGTIVSITKASPVSLTISGFDKVLDAFPYIFEWKREHARRMAKLTEERLMAETQKIRSEAAEGFARAAKIGAEADELESEARRKREKREIEELKRRREEIHLVHAKLALAENILHIFNDNIVDSARNVYIYRIFSELDKLLESRLEFDIQRSPSDALS